MPFLLGLVSQKQAAMQAQTTDEMSDDELASAAQADPRTFTALYERYFQKVYSYCYIRLVEREAAEDATSETFLKALAGLSGYRNGIFAAWLFQIAHNVIVDIQRKRRPQTLPKASYLPQPGSSLEEAFIRRSERQGVQEAVAQLPDEQRTVLQMQCAGWSGIQIAEAMGKSTAAVRMLRWRAVEKLRELIARQEVGQ
jgi:RNA polymerase sigma factor (sigma-70 family)